MKPVESSVVINRPVEACFAYLADLANDVRRQYAANFGRLKTVLEAQAVMR